MELTTETLYIKCPIDLKPIENGEYMMLNHEGKPYTQNMFDPVRFGLTFNGWFLFNNPKSVAFYLRPLTSSELLALTTTTPTTQQADAGKVEEAAKEYHSKALGAAGMDHPSLADAFLAGANWDASSKGDGWVRVEDGLPEESSTVLVYTDLAMTGSMWYSKQYGWHQLKAGAKVTHWRKLPSPPQEK